VNKSWLLLEFERLSEAPEAARKLKRLVLGLAVRGALAPQETGEEPFLEGMTRLIGTPLAIPQRSTGEPPLARLPIGWLELEVGGLCEKTGSGSTPRGGRAAYPTSGVPFLRSQNVYDDGLHLDNLAYISNDTHERMSNTAVLPNDLLLNITGGSIGRCALVPESFASGNVSQHVAILRPWHRDLAAYLHVAIRSPQFQAKILAAQTGAGRGGLPKNRMDRLTIPVPPLAEQRRIVTKVEELIDLCDSLERLQVERERRRDRLAMTSLFRVSRPVDKDSTATWHEMARFHIAHLNRMVTRPEHVKDLRKSILTCAVQGRLVGQDPNDEPAKTTLTRITSRTMGVSGKARTAAPVRAFGQMEVPFELPAGWSWERLGNIGDTNIGLTYSPQNLSEAGTPVLRSSNIQNGRLHLGDLVRVTCELKESVMVHDGDLLICARNGSRALVGKVAVIEGLKEPAAFGAFMAIFRSEMNRYLYLFMRSPLFRQMIDEVNTTTINQLTQANLRSTLAPIPPIAEQHRIVEEVDRLMAVCDELEAKLKGGQELNRRALDAVSHATLRAT
jgi:type I restriction enzyme S subunit